MITPPAPGAEPVVEPAPEQPAPAAPPTQAPSGFAIRIVDPAGAQVGEIVNTELGGTRTVVRGLDNGTAYRVQVAPTIDGNEPSFSGFSETVTPIFPEDLDGALDQGAMLPLMPPPPTDARTDAPAWSVNVGA